MIHVLIALVPVVLFLASLFFMDSFRLVPPAWIGAALAYGALVAVAALGLNRELLALHAPGTALTRYIAPAIEEALKALLLLVWLKNGRVGVLVDAAIQGFAVGTGFALVENAVYLGTMPGSLALWMVRGFGTAMLHGGATAIFAMMANTAADRHPDRIAPLFVPGWITASIIHAVFNYQLLPAVAQTCVILIALPALMQWIFIHSERAVRDWIGAGLDLDVELLQLVESDIFEATRMGRYLHHLRERLPGSVVADMYCLLRIELELAVQAKAMLLARDAGLDVPVDDDFAAALAEHEFLQRSIGPTGLLALKPLQVTSRRDRWHRHLLRQGG